MEKSRLLVMAMLLVLGLAACGAAAPDVDWQLTLGGAVSTPLTLSYADLAKMPQVDLKDVLMEKSRGEDTTGSWSGVALADLLGQAGASEGYVSITATAGDGYAIEISRDELAGAIVALKENGKWIATADPDHGPIRLVAPTTPANRWVYQLQAIEVNEMAGAGIPSNAALKVTGNVSTPVGWTEEKLRSMNAIQVQTTNKAGETVTYTGVPMADLLSKADPKDGATTLVLVADDGYTAEVALADVEACQDCIVAFADGGGFRSVLPGFASNQQVKGLIEIQVK